MIRVLLADDQALVRGGFRLILDAEPDIEVVAEAADGDQAVAGALAAKPDLVLMDIRMPVLDGIEATRRLIPQLSGTRVVMLTTFDLDEYVVDAFRSGASGFLLKTAPPAQLVAAIRTVHTGDGLLAPASTRRLIEQATRPTAPSPALETLTVRESDVLRLLARGLSNAEIAAQLVVEPSTVKSHVASVLAKLNLRDRVQAVVFAYENGLVRPGTHQPGPLDPIPCRTDRSSQVRGVEKCRHPGRLAALPSGRLPPGGPVVVERGDDDRDDQPGQVVIHRVLDARVAAAQQGPFHRPDRTRRDVGGSHRERVIRFDLPARGYLPVRKPSHIRVPSGVMLTPFTGRMPRRCARFLTAMVPVRWCLRTDREGRAQLRNGCGLLRTARTTRESSSPPALR